MKETEILRLIEGYIKECTDLECECECSDEVKIIGSEEKFTDEPAPQEAFVPYVRMTPVDENYEMDEENPCEQGASFNMKHHGCFDNLKGSKAKLKPGYRLDPKKGFIKTSDDKHVSTNTTETEHWHGQGMTAAHK